MRRLAAGLLALGLSVGSVAADAAPARDQARVGALLQAAFGVIPANEPGCVSGVSRDGMLVAVRADGLANLELGAPLKEDSTFDIGSASKQFTAASVAMLSLRGKIDLDGDIRDYLPEMRQLPTKVTVRQLLQHSGSLPDPYRALEDLTGDRDGNLYPSSWALDILGRARKTEFEPGSRYAYSNAGYLLLARIVERVSGQSLRDFTQLNLFGPLGMTHTRFQDNYQELVPNRAYAYGRRPDGKTWYARHSDFTVMGDGGAYSTVADMAKWYDSFAHPKFENGAKIIALMTTPAQYRDGGATWRDRPEQYGFAVQMLDWKGHKAVGHAGGWAGYTSAPYYFPEAGVSVIALCNTTNLRNLDAVLDLGAKLSEAPP